MEEQSYCKPPMEIYSDELKTALGSDAFKGSESPYTFLLGKDEKGNVHSAELRLLNNLLIIGALGTGKTSFIDLYLTSVMNKATPEELRIVLFSAKPNELSMYSPLPHLYCPIITDPQKGKGVVHWLNSEAERRFEKLTRSGARSIEQYNQKQASIEERLPRLVVIFDGIDILKYGADDTEEYLFELLKIGYKAGIHIIATVTHLGYNTFSSRCQSCMPNRVSFRTVTGRQSLTGIGIHGAEKLYGLGKMLFSSVFIEKPIELQSFYVSPETVEAALQYFITHKRACESNNRVILDSIPDLTVVSERNEGEDELLPAAARIVIEYGTASISMIQRRLRIGYSRAARLVDIMEHKGIVSGYDKSNARAVLIDEEGYRKIFGAGPFEVHGQEDKSEQTIVRDDDNAASEEEETKSKTEEESGLVVEDGEHSEKRKGLLSRLFRRKDR